MKVLTAQTKNKTAKEFILDGQSSMKIKGGINPLLNQQTEIPDTEVGFEHFARTVSTSKASNGNR
jgi:hypothetical protein